MPDRPLIDDLPGARVHPAFHSKNPGKTEKSGLGARPGRKSRATGAKADLHRRGVDIGPGGL
jgi:hypothetical protein